ncbi:hypothetical protein EJ110_NYTH21079 [Nymphaea thermarum]|nr:hypothetical protein EJ110_NYTH21079 [Nymphaea thermarum]
MAPVISSYISHENLFAEVKCVKGLNLWRNNSLDINAELFKGYRKGNMKKETNQFVAGLHHELLLTPYDLLDTNENRFSMWIWYNSTYKEDIGRRPMKLLRISRSLNLSLWKPPYMYNSYVQASNAYIQFLKGAGVKIPLEFVEEMPKSATQPKLSFSSLLGGLFFSWVLELLFPVMVTYLVYEKQRNLRIMMKMHGLGDGPYWLISYSYFLFISFVYMFGFVLFGSIIGLDFFRVNDYSLQFVLYFIYINLQIMLAFLASSIFSDVKTATGFLGMGLFQVFVEDETFPRKWVVVMELIPAFSLYRGLYELGQYSFIGQYMATKGMQWEDLNRSGNGMKAVLVIMIVEWFILLPVAYYLDQVVSAGSGVKKHPLFFLKCCQKRTAQILRRPNVQRQGSNVVVDMEKPDVCREVCLLFL